MVYSAARAGAGPVLMAGSASCALKVRRKVEPLPASLVTVMSPPIMRARLRETWPAGVPVLTDYPIAADAIIFAIRRINNDRQDNTTVGVVKIS